MKVAPYNNAYRPKAPYDLIRMGAEFDGGYVISKRLLSNSRGLLSFGLSDEWEFEEQFTRTARIPVVCFDHTVNSHFWARRFIAGMAKGIINVDAKQFRRGLRMFDYNRFFDGKLNRHIRKAIGYRGENTITLPEAISLASLPEPLTLKMDIEGWEYRILKQLTEMRNKFVGIIIEFHDIDLHEHRIIEFIRAISDRFALIHFHPNSETTVGPGGSALAVEMTFMAHSLLEPGEELYFRTLPIVQLDAPNSPGKQETVVNFSE
jgi:hypothetical protein